MYAKSHFEKFNAKPFLEEKRSKEVSLLQWTTVIAVKILSTYVDIHCLPYTVTSNVPNSQAKEKSSPLDSIRRLLNAWSQRLLYIKCICWKFGYSSEIPLCIIIYRHMPFHEWLVKAKPSYLFPAISIDCSGCKYRDLVYCISVHFP